MTSLLLSQRDCGTWAYELERTDAALKDRIAKEFFDSGLAALTEEELAEVEQVFTELVDDGVWQGEQCSMHYYHDGGVASWLVEKHLITAAKAVVKNIGTKDDELFDSSLVLLKSYCDEHDRLEEKYK